MNAHELFQLFVGEIGINWHDYLYELRYWHILLISRGYAKRQRPAWEQARLAAYSSAFALGSKNTPPEIQEWLPFPWEQQQEKILEADEIEEIRNRIREENKKNSGQQ